MCSVLVLVVDSSRRTNTNAKKKRKNEKSGEDLLIPRSNSFHLDLSRHEHMTDESRLPAYLLPVVVGANCGTTNTPILTGAAKDLRHRNNKVNGMRRGTERLHRASVAHEG